MEPKTWQKARHGIILRKFPNNQPNKLIMNNFQLSNRSEMVSIIIKKLIFFSMNKNRLFTF